MTKTWDFVRTIFGFLLVLTSCDKPACNNSSAIFDNFSPETKEYKNELANQLSKVDQSKLTYCMEVFQETDTLPYILAHVQGEGLCAKIMLIVDESDKGIEGLIQKKGASYSGAELKGLKFKIIQDNATTAFVFQEISEIED